jgi:hypothetical protein
VLEDILMPVDEEPEDEDEDGLVVDEEAIDRPS